MRISFKSIQLNISYYYNSIMKKTIFITSCMIYFVSSVFINLFGQLSTDIMSSLDISQSKIAVILTFEAVGGLAASLFLGAFGERYDKLKTVIVSAMILSAGMILMLPAGSLDSYTLIFIFLMIANTGYIAIDLTMNSMISELYREKKNYLLPIIHIFYGLGAMTAPLYVVTCSHLFNNNLYGKTYFICGVASLVLSMILYLSSAKGNTERTYTKITDPLEIFRQRKTWYYLLTALFYALFQTGMASWLADYNINRMNMTASSSGLIISLYFSCALIMRLVSTLILKKMPVKNYYFISGLSASICLITGLCSHNITVYTIMLLLTGFFSGGLVPSYMIIVTDEYPARQSSSTSIFVFAVCISNLFAPIFGKIIENGTRDAAMYLIGACLLVSAVLIGSERKNRHE